MENASKALIIAGSILLSILIIALGMYIFSKATTSSDMSQVDETVIQAFNAKFENFNKKQRGSDVLSLINAVRANATSNQTSKNMIPGIEYTSSAAISGYTVVSGISAISDKTLTITGDQDLSSGTKLSDYVNALSVITNDIQKSHTYKVSMEYNDSGLISKIIIKYE